MRITRSRLLVPVAIGAAALSLAGTGAAFAAGTAHSHATTNRHLASRTELKTDASLKETTADVRVDRTKDSPGPGSATGPRADISKDPAGVERSADPNGTDTSKDVIGTQLARDPSSPDAGTVVDH
jgi:hypothetical protein